MMDQLEIAKQSINLKFETEKQNYAKPLFYNFVFYEKLKENNK